MISRNIHTGTLHEKVGQFQPASSFCKRLINPTVHTWCLDCTVYLNIVNVPYRGMPRLQNICPETLEKNQNINTLPWPARNPDLAPIRHVGDF